jgi:hypothetical protein
MFFLLSFFFYKIREKEVRTVSAKSGGGGVVQIMYTCVYKCKNDKIKFKKRIQNLQFEEIQQSYPMTCRKFTKLKVNNPEPMFLENCRIKSTMGACTFWSETHSNRLIVTLLGWRPGSCDRAPAYTRV